MKGGTHGGREEQRERERMRGEERGPRKGKPPSPKTNIIWSLDVLECLPGGASRSLLPLPPGLLKQHFN